MKGNVSDGVIDIRVYPVRGLNESEDDLLDV